MSFIESVEREFFEEACYEHYLQQKASGKLDGQPGDGDGSRESLMWRHEDGTYGVQAFNAAWFGWSQRAMLHLGHPASTAVSGTFRPTDRANGDGL